MQLVCGRAELLYLTYAMLRGAIIERRSIIRWHRDQRLDDRCWLDDYLVWSMCDDSPAEPLMPPPFEEAMQMCRQFYQFRRARNKDSTSVLAIFEKSCWDYDLTIMTQDQLLNELVRIQEAIRQHRDIVNRPRTVKDDRLLYSVLPEKIPADFRLPPKKDFLGEAKALHAGCPAFWQSHTACTSPCHNLHRWGPCV